MGIAGYFRSIIKKFSDTLVPVVPNEIQIHYLFMDFNSIVYNIVPTVLKKYEDKKLTNITLEKKIIDEVVKYTKHLVSDIVRPSKMLYIAFDGVAPRAKMVQQRSRRYKAIQIEEFQTKLRTELGMEDKLNHFETSIHMTPGSQFMTKLSKKFLEIIKEKGFTTYSNDIKVIFSDSSIPQEAEHKYLHIIKELRDNKNTENDNVVILSPDADTIVLSISTHKNNIYIIKQPDLSDKNQLKFENFEFIYLSIDKCKEHFYNEIKGEYNKNIDYSKILIDYLFCTMITGDDFVVSLPILKIAKEGLTRILGYYKKIRKELDEYLIEYEEEPIINMKFLIKLFEYLASDEDKLLKIHQKNINRIMNGQLSNRTITSEEKMSPYEVITSRRDHLELCSPFNPLYEEYIKDFKKINYLQEHDVWKTQYYKYFLGNNNVHDITNLVSNYLESLIFNLKYYLIGCPSWYWYYKYRIAPLPSDVVSILKLGFNVNNIIFNKSTPYTPFQQLSLILPPSKFNVLPKSFIKILDDEELKKFYPNEFRIDAVQGIKYIYSEAILPEIETDLLLNKIVELEKNLTPTEKKRNMIINKPYEII